jgi:hypothetical protein
VQNAYLNDLIYCAGPLSGSECDYIKNLNRMVETADEVEQLKVGTVIPGLDFLHGAIKGNREYFHYAKNSMIQMTRCDAVFLGEGWEDSKGCKLERGMANKLNIPVFTTLNDLKDFVNRPKILCIVGESGSGKTHAADFIEKEYGIPMVRSYTTRPKRTPDEDSHTFLTEEEFDKIPEKDMIVETVWEGNRYCCKHTDLGKHNTYVIDEKGYTELKFNYPHLYKIAGLRMWRVWRDRVNSVGMERVKRDEYKFNLADYCYDFKINNSFNLNHLEHWLNETVEAFFGVEPHW